MCLSVGIDHDENVKSIEVKNHGYKQNSFFRVGLDKLKKALDHVFDDINRLNSLLTKILHKIVRNFSLRNLDKEIIT